MIISCIILGLAPYSRGALTARDKYHLAEACYKDLRNNPRKQKYRHYWLGCIRRFQDVYRHDPSGPWAAAGLYQSAVLYQQLYRHSGRKADELEALDIYRRVTKRFPASKYRSRAAAAIASILKKHRKSKTGGSPRSARLTAKKKRPKPTTPFQKSGIPRPVPSSVAVVTGLRSWSSSNYTRVVIDADKETSYIHRYLKKDPILNKPHRLYIDLNNSVLGEKVQKTISINDALLLDARAAQHTPDSVRVVLDIKSYKPYKIFSLKNPFRIVLDLWDEWKKRPTPRTRSKSNPLTIPSGALAKQLALKVRRIVVDPGHGGRDFGAPG
ncbi:MAG: AMIN domain-containing protein, partial [Deltaproteobacteria bacterium]|nr:AMIN domain-containing protein [Deltaproteobacteria bacterium]